jgi:putative DNA primase/helicase
MACAVKSELGEAGFSVWDNWSKTSDKYNFKDARDTWKSARAGGKITIGTLIGEAKRCGWNRDPNKAEQLRQRQSAPANVPRQQPKLQTYGSRPMTLAVMITLT